MTQECGVHSCPICDVPMLSSSATMDAWGSPLRCEEELVCPRGHYASFFAYGDFEVTVGQGLLRCTFRWSYVDRNVMPRSLLWGIVGYRSFEKARAYILKLRALTHRPSAG